MKIAVIGTGYVGLVTGTCFSETGNYVTCVDNNEEKLAQLKSGIIPIYEPGLKVLFERNVQHGRLKFTTDLEAAVRKAEVVFLALPTPPNNDGSADLSYVLNMASEISTMIDSYKVIVDKSTVPVGTADLVHAEIAKNTKADFDVVSNPEFLREGVAVEDFMKPDRVVVGTTSEKAMKVMEEIYQPYVRQGNPIVFMDERSAEMTKYAANSFLATKISFMNEIANLCELVGANVDNVRKGIGSDDRIGKRFLFPGVGYGGSCFPKDVQALKLTSDQNNYDFKILNAVIDVNQLQRERFLDKILKKFNGNINGLNVAIWGLAFKPNTDDIREAPAIHIINELLQHKVNIRVYDPEAMSNVKNAFGDQLQYAQDHYDTLQDADFLIIVTEWSVFRTPNFDRMKSLMRQHIIFDGRNLFRLEQLKKDGFYYESIGRSTIDN